MTMTELGVTGRRLLARGGWRKSTRKRIAPPKGPRIQIVGSPSNVIGDIQGYMGTI